MSEHSNYTDIKRSDIQKYMPYGVATITLIVYYILVKVSVPLLLSFFLLLAGLWASIYLMTHHTDKKRLPNLVRFDAFLLYFPMVSLLQIFASLWYLLKDSGISILEFLLNSSAIDEQSNVLSGGMNVIENIVMVFAIGYIGACVVVLILYFIMKKYSMQQYHISWYGVFTNMNTTTYFKAMSETLERTVKRICYMLCVIVFIVVIGVIVYEYNIIKDIKPIMNEWNGITYYGDDAVNLTMSWKSYLYILIVISGILPLYGMLKSKRKKIYGFMLLWLWIYCGGIILFTTLENEIYVKAPMTWMVTGIVMVGIYGCIQYWKKRKNRC